MKLRLAPLALAALALAAGPPAAGAKGFTALRLCGADGCRTTHSAAALDAAMNSEPQAAPDHAVRFYRVRLTMGGEGMPREGYVNLQWLPGLGLLRTPNPVSVDFSLPRPATLRALRHLSRGLRALPAHEMGALSYVVTPRPKVPNAPQLDPQAPAAPADRPSHARGQDGGSGWAWSLLSIAPVGIAFWLYRRRRGRPSLA
jgi:hypothetical protein